MASDRSQLHFVVLFHEGVADPHYDLMFELEPGGKLATWRSPRWPIDQPTDVHELAPHRREYLEYEGPVSGGRGWVRRVAKGTYRRSEEGARWRVQFDAPADLSSIILEPAEHACWHVTLPE